MNEELIEFAGRLHPMLLHVPIGVLVALVIVELLGVVRRRPIEQSVRLALVWLLALCAAVSVGSGILLSEEPGYVGETVDLHRWLGIATGAALVVAAVLASIGRVRAYAGTLIIAAMVLVPTGHLGASMTHGEGFLTAPFQDTAVDGGTAGNGTAAEESLAGNERAATGAQSTTYAAQIAPLLDAHCAACHGPNRRKAKLALHTPEAILAGSAGGSVLGTADEPGALLQRVRLPLEHDDHMPPEGKPQLSPEQIALLAAWIESGASFDTTGSDAVAVPPATGSPGAGEGRSTGQPPVEIPAAAVAALRAATVHVEVIDPAAGLLWIDMAAASELPASERVRLLAPLSTVTADLTLQGAQDADELLVRAGPWTNLRRLDLTGSHVGAGGLTAAAASGNLAELTLVRATVTADAADALAAIRGVRIMHVWDAQLPAGAIDRLRARSPELALNEGAADPPPALEVEPAFKFGAPEVLASLAPVNTTCPVSGQPVDAKFAVVHDGRVIAFCCEVCAATFWDNPAAYEAALTDGD